MRREIRTEIADIANWRDIVGEEARILRYVDRHGNIGEKLEPSAVSYILRQVQANITLPGNKKNSASGRSIRFVWAQQST